MRPRLLVLLLAVVLLTTAWVFGERLWSPSYKELARRRNELASRRTEADLQVALVKTSASPSAEAFVLGAMMAKEEINKAGGVKLFDAQTGETFSRPLSIQVYAAPAPEGSTSERVNRGIILAHQIAADPNVVAVLGHSFDAAIAVSVVYNAYEVIYFATRTTEPALTSHRDMPFVFRICPSDNDIMYEVVDLVPTLVSNNIVSKKKVKVLLLYPELKARLAHDDPVKRLSASAAKLIGNTLVEFTVEGLPYDQDSPEKVFRNDENEKLIRDADRFNVVMIADLSIAATTLRERIEEIWTNQLLGEREQEKPFPPKIFDLGELVGYGDQKRDSLSVPTEFVEFDYESMVRLILKETKQNAVVLFERDSSEAAEGVRSRSSRSAPISSRSGYGKRLIAYLEEELPLTEDTVEALCQLSVLNVVLARSYDPKATDFAELVAEVAKVPRDYVYLIGFNRSALELLKQLRRANVLTPVFGSPRLEEQLGRANRLTPVIGSPRLEEKPEDGDTPEQLGVTYVATTFDAWSDAPHVTTFLRKYRAYLERVGSAATEDIENEFPGSAAYGYVSVQLLKRAFEGAKTASPRMAAEVARLFIEIDGPLGNVGFKGGRDLFNLPIGFQRLGFRDAQHFIPGSRTRRRLRSPANRPDPSLSRP